MITNDNTQVIRTPSVERAIRITAVETTDSRKLLTFLCVVGAVVLAHIVMADIAAVYVMHKLAELGQQLQQTPLR